MKAFFFSIFLVSLSVSSVFSQESTDSASSEDKVVDKGEDELIRPTLTVTVIQPNYQQSFQTLEASGNIEAREIAYVTTQATGLSLNKLYAAVGNVVTKGALLAEYDSATVRNDIVQAKASLAEASVVYAQAKVNAKRGKRLRKSTAISAMEADNFAYKEKQARTRLHSAKAVLANQNLRLSYSKVHAKFSGLIIEKMAVLGEVGNPGTKLFSAIVDNKLEWQANVPSQMLNNIYPKMPVEVLLSESNGTGGNFLTKVLGMVRRVDPTINSQTRQGKVYVAMQPNPKLRRGLFVTGAFILGARDLLVVPVDSLIRKDGYSYVFVVNDKNLVERRKVDIGELQGQGMTIKNGLSSDDRVVSSGVGFLNSGDLVKIVDTIEKL